MSGGAALPVSGVAPEFHSPAIEQIFPPEVLPQIPSSDGVDFDLKPIVAVARVCASPEWPDSSLGEEAQRSLAGAVGHLCELKKKNRELHPEERATLLVALSHIYATHVVGRDSRPETANVCACRELAVAASFFMLSSTAEPPPPLQLYGPIGEAFEREHARASWKNNAGPKIRQERKADKAMLEVHGITSCVFKAKQATHDEQAARYRERLHMRIQAAVNSAPLEERRADAGTDE